MTLKFLLDTTNVSAPIAKEPNRRVVKKLKQQGDHCAIAGNRGLGHLTSSSA
jgi:hypothetical protein